MMSVWVMSDDDVVIEMRDSQLNLHERERRQWPGQLVVKSANWPLVRVGIAVAVARLVAV